MMFNYLKIKNKRVLKNFATHLAQSCLSLILNNNCDIYLIFYLHYFTDLVHTNLNQKYD